MHTKPYVAIINGNETAFEADPTADKWSSSSVKSMVERIVREAGLTTPRTAPVPIAVRVEAVEVQKGKLARRHTQTLQITPPLTRMTDAEFAAEEAALLAPVPVDFHSALSGMAYERGHSSGYEEVINCLAGLISDLRPAIEAFAHTCTKL